MSRNLCAQTLLCDEDSFHGYLQKFNKRGKKQNRFCVLHKGTFYYYKDAESKKPQGYFKLSGYRAHVCEEHGTHTVFKVKHEVAEDLRPYFFRTISRNDQDVWIEKINGHVLKHFPDSLYCDGKSEFYDYIDVPSRSKIRQLPVKVTNDYLPDKAVTLDSKFVGPTYGSAKSSTMLSLKEIDHMDRTSYVMKKDDLHLHSSGDYIGMNQQDCQNMADGGSDDYIKMSKGNLGECEDYENIAEGNLDGSDDYIKMSEGNLDECEDYENIAEGNLDGSDDYMKMSKGNSGNSEYEQHYMEMSKGNIGGSDYDGEDDEDSSEEDGDNPFGEYVVETQKQMKSMTFTECSLHEKIETKEVVSSTKSLPPKPRVPRQRVGNTTPVNIVNNNVMPPSCVFKNIPKEECSTILHSREIGTYLVRKGKEGKDAIAVVARKDPSIKLKHFHIFVRNGEMYLEKNERRFALLTELIEYYYDHPLPCTEIKLVGPV